MHFLLVLLIFKQQKQNDKFITASMSMYTGTDYMPRLCVNSVSRVSVVILIPIQATFKH